MRSPSGHPPLILLLAAYGAGLATGLARFPDPRLSLSALVLATLVAWRNPLHGFLAGGALLGALAGAAAWELERGRCAAQLQRGALTLTLVPLDPPPVEAGRVEAEVVGAGCRDPIAVRWGRSAPRVAVGQAFRVTGTWHPRPEGVFGRPGGTLVVASATPARGSRADPRDDLHPSHSLRARAALLATTTRLYGERAPLVDALLFDRRGAIDRSTRDRFAASGLIHVLSISGFHVGLITAWVLGLLRALRVSRERAWVVATITGVTYVAWLGWPAPATRAAALAVLMCVARLRQRVVRWEALLAATAFVVLLVDPWALVDLGAWLSVASLWGATVLVRWSDRRVGTDIVTRTLCGSGGATHATPPLTVGAVGSVSLAGVVMNFAGIPVAAIAVPAVLGSVLVAPLWTGGAEALAAGGGALLALLDRLAALGAAIPYGHYALDSGWGAALPWALALGGILWALSGRATRAVALARLSVVAASALWILTGKGLYAATRGPREGELTLAFLDVGQGDATAIRTPHGAWLLVDAGPSGEGRDAGRRVVLPYLRSRGARRIEVALLSHAHLDHFGGFGAVLDELPVERFVEPGQGVDDPGYLALLDQVAASGTEWRSFRRGDSLAIDGVWLIALHPDTSWAEWGLDLNEDSDVLLLRYGGFTALLAGDAGVPAERALRGRVGDIDLLKVGHHGSAGASGAEWLGELRPEVAVVSVGRGNRYGHPSPPALDRLRAAGAEVWRTDELGTIELRTDGRTFTIAAGGRHLALPAGPPRP